MKMKITQKQLKLILHNVPKGKSIKANINDLDRLAKMVTNRKK